MALLHSKVIIYTYSFFLWRCGPMQGKASPVTRFLDHTQRPTTVGRTPLDEWSARRRDLYLITHNTHNKQISMPCQDLSRRAAADLRLRPRGHWGRPQPIITTYNWHVKNSICDTGAENVASHTMWASRRGTYLAGNMCKGQRSDEQAQTYFNASGTFVEVSWMCWGNTTCIGRGARSLLTSWRNFGTRGGPSGICHKYVCWVMGEDAGGGRGCKYCDHPRRQNSKGGEKRISHNFHVRHSHCVFNN